MEQPAPTPNRTRPVWDLVLEDMQARDRLGRARYGTPLQAFNGRKSLRDLYEELLDAVVYTRQALVEQETKGEDCLRWLRSLGVKLDPAQAAAIRHIGPGWEDLQYKEMWEKEVAHHKRSDGAGPMLALGVAAGVGLCVLGELAMRWGASLR